MEPDRSFSKVMSLMATTPNTYPLLAVAESVADISSANVSAPCPYTADSSAAPRVVILPGSRPLIVSPLPTTKGCVEPSPLGMYRLSPCALTNSIELSVGSTDSNVMVPDTPGATTILSPSPALASACRNDPAPESLVVSPHNHRQARPQAWQRQQGRPP